MGPPGLDVGNLVAHVEEHSLRRYGNAGHLADTTEAILDRYLELSDRTTRGAIRAWTTISLARHIAISRQFPERQPFTGALLDLCERRVCEPSNVQ